VPIKAFADAIAVTPLGNWQWWILRLGAYMPDSSLQLGIYASMMEMQFGIRPSKGYYYSARKAQFIEAVGLDRLDRSRCNLYCGNVCSVCTRVGARDILA
jgi:hypothetical protein